MKPRLKLVEPDAENRAVAPTRLANSEYRSREHLTPSEVEKNCRRPGSTELK
jgi:hypothetical protein